MKGQSRKLIKWIFILAAVLTVFLYVTASGESSGTCGENVTWTLDDAGLLTISGTGSITSHPWGEADVKEVNIENGVTTIAYSAFYRCSNLTSITIPESVTDIRQYAFCNCSSLTSITIPDSVTNIEDSTFSGCPAIRYANLNSDGARALSKAKYSFRIPENNCDLQYQYSTQFPYREITGLAVISAEEGAEEITIPAGVTVILYKAFYNCSKLINITIPDSVTSIGYSAFYNCGKLMNITLPDSITSIGYSAFNKCSSLTNISIPDSVTSIGDSVFKGCNSLTSISIPAGITSIRESVFSGCSSLTSISIPDSITSIGDSVFSGCSSLTSISIPHSVTSIGDSVFSDCSNLTSITIPDSITSIGDSVFSGCSSLTNIAIPESVTSIGSYAFSDCSSLTSITIPTGITSISVCAFSGCSNLTNITIPDSVTSIGGSAFSDCSSLTSITIPASVTSIGGSAFSGCTSLTSISIPEGVTNISNRAFYNCNRLTNITIPADVTSIEGAAFYGCSSLTSIMIPAGVTSIGYSAFYNCSSLTNITIPEGVTSIEIYTFSGCSSLTSITIPAGVAYIDSYAFKDCSSLTNITIPAGVTSIEGCAFNNCSSLTNITIPEGVTSIGGSAFSGCSNLASIALPDSVTSIGIYAFKNCNKLTSITIPAGVTSIEKSVFSGCSNLASIGIPDSVTSIGTYAFSDCSSLTGITIPDGLTNIEDGAFSNCSAKLYAVIGSNSAKVLSKAGYSFTVKGYENLQLEYNPADDSDLILIKVDKDSANVTIPEGVTNIRHNALFGCNKLKGIIIPEGVKTIGSYGIISYYGDEAVSLVGAVIPDSVTTIDYDIFGKKAVIYCNEYTVAEKWANDHGHKVVLLDSATGAIEPMISVKDAITLRMGITYNNLDESIFPYDKDTKIIYTSANESIVRIADDGKIIPEATGETTITISANGISETTDIAVIQTATSFSVPTDIYVLAKGTADVTVSNIVPENATLQLTWRMNDSSFANVDQNGRITGGAIGDTSLTVTDELSGLTYSVAVHVVRPVSKIEFAEKEVSVDQDDTIELKATVYMGSQQAPDNTMVTFTSSDPGIATVDEKGVVKGLNPGTVVITASSENGLGDTCTVHVIGTPLREPEVQAPDYLKQGENLGITLGGDGIEFAIVTIKDAAGNPVSQQQINGTTIEVTTSTLPNGTYTIEVQAGSSIRQTSDATTISVIVNNLGDDPAATTDVTLKIAWNDQENIDGLRPNTLAYQLNGTAVDPVVTDWTAVLTGLPKYENDAVIDYQWSVTVPDEYNQANKQIEGYLTTITLEHIHTHVYHATYGWSEDGTACEITLTCEKGDSTPKIAAAVDRQETTPATCTTAGEATFTATLTYEGVDYSDSTTRPVAPIPHVTEVTKAGYPATCTEDGLSDELTCTACLQVIQEQEVIPALQHDWEEPTYAWAADNNTVTATRNCRNGNHPETETVGTACVTTPATYTAAGKTVYTAIFSNPAFATQTKEIAIPQLDPPHTPPTEETEKPPEPPTIEPGPFSDATGDYTVKADGTAVFNKLSASAGATVTINKITLANGLQVDVTEISANAFAKNKKVKKVSIGPKVKKIGKKAFFQCVALTTVNGGQGLEQIMDSAFEGCKALQKFTFYAKLTKIGKKAFFNCEKLKTLTFKSTKSPTMGANAFGNIFEKAKAKAPKKDEKNYSKNLKKAKFPNKDGKLNGKKPY